MLLLEASSGKNQNQPMARKELWESSSLVHRGRVGSRVSTQRGKGGGEARRKDSLSRRGEQGAGPAEERVPPESKWKRLRWPELC